MLVYLISCYNDIELGYVVRLNVPVDSYSFVHQYLHVMLLHVFLNLPTSHSQQDYTSITNKLQHHTSN